MFYSFSIDFTGLFCDFKSIWICWVFLDQKSENGEFFVALFTSIFNFWHDIFRTIWCRESLIDLKKKTTNKTQKWKINLLKTKKNWISMSNDLCSWGKIFIESFMYTYMNACEGGFIRVIRTIHSNDIFKIYEIGLKSVKCIILLEECCIKCWIMY